MASPDPTDELRRWSGPMENLGESERRSLLDSMLPNGRPRIEIGEALRNNWFEIWYQPKIDLKRKCLAGAEALARIRHPALGVLLPGSFLPAATEDSIQLLTEHALLSTLRAWSTFDAAGFNLHLAINVPVSVLLKLPIPAIVREYRPKADHWPGLILEVTEDQIVRDIKLAHEIATQLRISGITISIDDFGAGYSSFSSLRELPFAEIKLDSSFVKN
jgi:EAL domain-containing protein (putative c-di-GMP-specific phosphodiesterase class I)